MKSLESSLDTPIEIDSGWRSNLARLAFTKCCADLRAYIPPHGESQVPNRCRGGPTGGLHDSLERC